jgi:alkylhydroperoxidase family enzyme
LNVSENTIPYTAEQESHDLDIRGELIPLVEKAVRADGTIPIKIIAPGWGSSGFYPADVLERDGPKVFTKGLHSYWNHPSASEERDRPERDLRDLAGVLTEDAHWDANGPAGPGLYSQARVAEQYRSTVADLAPYIGMSIRAYGKAREGEADGRKGNVISELASARSVDFVTAAGAGGKILELFEAAGRPLAKGDDQVTEEEAKTLREMNEALTAQLTEKDALIASLREAVLLRQAQEVASQVLAEIEMPTPTRQKLMKMQEAMPVRGEDGTLDEAAYREQVKTAAQAELAYINEVRSSGKITGMGGTSGGTGDSHAALVEAFKRMGLTDEQAETAARGRH